MPPRKARFLTGSTMRHVIVMTGTGSLGLMFLFLVDFVTLFWVGQLGDERLVAAMGFAWTVQFSTMSVNIGFMIAATAMVSKSLGQGKFEEARKQATSSALYSFSVQVVLTAIVYFYRREILSFAGADGEALEQATLFLGYSLPSLPIMGIGMIGSAILRAEGDAIRSMVVTLSAGIVAMIVDPLLILGMGLGVKGAALGIVSSRAVSFVLAIWFVIRVHNLAAMVTRADMIWIGRPFFLIALPAILTQMSTPFGNYILTKIIATYGDSAVAGWAVTSRLTVLGFGGIFAMSGAIGGIIGQNFGAGQFNRVTQAYKDALVFCAGYTLVVWAILALSYPYIIKMFGLSSEGADVLRAFAIYGVGGFIFTGALFASNAAFNNLGKPHYSSVMNWLRDGVIMYPVCAVFAGWWAAPGAIYGQAFAGIVVGIVATMATFAFLRRLIAQQ